jgi:xylulokinase
MSLLGIDAGTTGCKAAVFGAGGLLASAYEEYAYSSPQPGWAELDPQAVWAAVRRVIAAAVARAGPERVSALADSSMGDDRRPLGPSLLNFDLRGQEYLPELRGRLSPQALYRINGNTLGNQYGLTKLMWLARRRPELYERTALFLNWSGFLSHLLGGEPAVDYSLANRSLLFDLDRRDWSEELLAAAGLERSRLPRPVPSGTPLGTVLPELAAELGLSRDTRIVAGAHDQCANAVGCGVTGAGEALLGLGTYLCIVPVHSSRPAPGPMLASGLNTEHHAVPGRFVSFLYNMGGALVRWYRDTFAGLEARRAREQGLEVYDRLFAELPGGPSEVLVLPHFSPTGPPDFIENSRGLITGLTLQSRRADILQGILQSAVFELKTCVDLLPRAGMSIRRYRAAGGGSRSDAWLQLCADVLGAPFVRPRVSEAGTLGAAILAGAGTGLFASIEEGAERLVSIGEGFEPDPGRGARYAEAYARYRQLWPLLRDFLTAVPGGAQGGASGDSGGRAG